MINLPLGQRQRGVLIASCTGPARGFAIFNLQNRGIMFLDHQDPSYEGMVVGINSRDNDLVVNVTKEKQLNNIRAAGTDENIVLTSGFTGIRNQVLSNLFGDHYSRNPTFEEGDVWSFRLQ